MKSYKKEGDGRKKGEKGKKKRKEKVVAERVGEVVVMKGKKISLFKLLNSTKKME